MSTVFLRVVGASDRASALRVAIHGAETGRSKARFEVDSAAFPGVPKSPFAYWVSPQVRQLFTKCESVESGSRVARRTNSVDDNSRYVRLYWEVAPHELGSVWHPWAKGGAHSAYYYDIDTVIAWDARRNTFPGFVGTESRPQARPASLQHFFRPGVTWPARSQKGLTLRAMPGGSIFAAKGPAIFVADDAPAELLTLLSIANSSVFRMLVDLQMAFGSFEVGVIQSTPLPTLTVKDAAILAEKARRAGHSSAASTRTTRRPTRSRCRRSSCRAAHLSQAERPRGSTTRAVSPTNWRDFGLRSTISVSTSTESVRPTAGRAPTLSAALQ